jgi:hypothetical protein
MSVNSNNYRREQPWEDTEEALTERQYISIASDLLEQMFEELLLLAIDDPQFAGVLSRQGAAVRVDLTTLHEIAQSLSQAEGGETARMAMRRAGVLIYQLSDEIDDLASLSTESSYYFATFGGTWH